MIAVGIDESPAQTTAIMLGVAGTDRTMDASADGACVLRLGDAANHSIGPWAAR
jgi:hypothetical protein